MQQNQHGGDESKESEPTKKSDNTYNNNKCIQHPKNWNQQDM